MKPRILLVDDDDDIAALVRSVLNDIAQVRHARNLAEARLELGGAPQLVLLDLRLSGEDGAALLTEITTNLPLSSVVILSGSGTLERAVDLFRDGVDDYIIKPVPPQLLRRRVERILQRHASARALEDLRGSVGNEDDAAFQRLALMPSPPMRELCDLIRRYSRAALPVLIEGETGTGKELVARAVHGLSPRRNRPFVAVNCGAIARELVESELFGHTSGAFTGAGAQRRGLVREASGGTLFLDEIGELPIAVQPKLLRLLQEGEARAVGSDTSQKVDVRVVAATHVNLVEAVADNRFREDLFHRLAVLRLRVPPLRERRSDIPVLAEGFAREASSHGGRVIAGFEKRALRAMVAGQWTGNVRELQNKVRRAVIITAGTELTAEDLGLSSSVDAGDGSLPWSAALLQKPFHEAKDEVLAGFESDYVTAALTAAEGNVAEAARRSGLPRKSLWRIACRNGLDADRASRRAGVFDGDTEDHSPDPTALDGLRVEARAYLGRLGPTVDEIANRLAGPMGLADWVWLQDHAHRIMGSAGSYGFGEASTIAERVLAAAGGVDREACKLEVAGLAGWLARASATT